MADKNEPQQEPQPGPRQPINLATAASLLVGASAIVGALAILAGWEYTRAYYRQFGIDPNALDFSPYEYALRSKLALTHVLAMLFGLAVGVGTSVTRDRVPESHWLQRFFGPLPESRARTVLRGFFFTYLAASLALAVIDFMFLKRGIYLFMFPFLAAMWTYIVVGFFLDRRAEYFIVGAVSLLVAFAALVLLIPAGQGEYNGKCDRKKNLNRFPEVSIISQQELGLEHEHDKSGLLLYGPYRLILSNAGMYYLVSEDDPNQTIAVPETFVVHLELRRPGYKTPAPTPTPTASRPPP